MRPLTFASSESMIAKTAAPFGCARAAAAAKRLEIWMGNGCAWKEEGIPASRLLSWRRMTGARIAVHVSSTSMLGTTDPDQVNR